jgi:hypothetical protein
MAAFNFNTVSMRIIAQVVRVFSLPALGFVR